MDLTPLAIIRFHKIVAIIRNPCDVAHLPVSLIGKFKGWPGNGPQWCLNFCCDFYRFDTIRRRMQVQNLHIPPEQRMNSFQQFSHLVTKEGLSSVYRGLTPELLKVVRVAFVTIALWVRRTLHTVSLTLPPCFPLRRYQWLAQCLRFMSFQKNTSMSNRSFLLGAIDSSIECYLIVRQSLVILLNNIFASRELLSRTSFCRGIFSLLQWWFSQP